MRYSQNNPDPWDSGVYRNGSTKPPKNHAGVLAVLLVSVILLCGIVSVLSLLNIRLFREMEELPDPELELPVVYSNTDCAGNALTSINQTTPTCREPRDAVQSETSPASPENLPQADAMSLQQIYDTVIPSVVSITCSGAAGSSTGTGLILSQEGYIVTNSHVVENAQQIRVLLTDGRLLDAALVGEDPISDLAVLHIDAPDLVAARLGDSGVLRVGDPVVAIGDPLGIELRGTMTDGIISAINRDIVLEGRTMNLIQTNAALNSGNSGGPLINCYGQVIGINTMKMTSSMNHTGVEGLGFAIPSVTVKDIVNQLIEQGFVSGRPDLGITGEAVSSFYHFYYRLPQGLLITAVEEGSAAWEAGLEEGDVLLALDGASITGSESFKTALYAYAPGDVLQALVYRGGRQYTVAITVGEAGS